MGDLRIIGKGAAYTFAGVVLAKGMAYLWRIIIARIGPEGYGLFSLALAVLGIVSVVSFLGLDSAITRYIAYYQGKNDPSRMKGVITSTLKITLPISFILSAIVFLYSDFISITIFKNPNLSSLIKIMSLGIIPSIVYSISISALTGLKKIEFVVFSKQIVESVIRLIATLIMLYLGYGILGVGFAYVASYFFAGASALYFLEMTHPFIRTKIRAVSLKKELLGYSLPLLMSGIIYQILTWTDTFMLGYFKTASDVGIYNTAVPTAGLLLMASGALSTLFIPVITTAYAKGLMKNIHATHIKITKLIVAANTPIFLLMFFFSKDILTFLFGKEYSGGAITLSILSIGIFISSAVTTSSQILSMLKKTKTIMVLTILSLITNAGLDYVLIPIYGMNGAAFASTFSIIFTSFFISVFAFKSIKIHPFDKSLIHLLLLSVISMGAMYFGLHAIYDIIPLISAILGVAFFFGVYACAIIKFKIIEWREILEMINLLKNKTKLLTNGLNEWI